MTRNEKEKIAKAIAELEQSDLAPTEAMDQMAQLVKNCSFKDLLDIDIIITEKYLTN